MLLGILLLALGSASALAEYYSQHLIPYEESKREISRIYSDYNNDSSAASADESSVLEESRNYYKPLLKIGVNKLDKKQGISAINIGNLESPAGAIRSLRVGSLKVNPENVSDVLYREMADMSPDLHDKLASTLAHNNVDHKKYRDFFLIKKRVIDDGKRRIINFNIREKIVPKEIQEGVGISRDLVIKALLGGIMFLLAGLVFTTTLKMYQSIVKNNYFNIEGKNELFTEIQKVVPS